jgi:hypothetical protein
MVAPRVVAPVEPDAPVVVDKHKVIEAPLVDLSTPRAGDACKVNEELAPGISELLLPMVEEADKDTEAVVVEEMIVVAEKQN